MLIIFTHVSFNLFCAEQLFGIAIVVLNTPNRNKESITLAKLLVQVLLQCIHQTVHVARQEKWLARCWKC